MFDIGWSELLVVAVVMILVVGPKELPGMLRTIGQTIKKVRGMAGDFQRQFDDALKDTELEGVRDTIKDVRSMNPTNAIKDKLNPLKDSVENVEKDLNKNFDYSPDELFDESKADHEIEPVKVDVEAALKLQEQNQRNSGVNAVPGFTSDSKEAAKSAAPKPTATKSKPATANKSAAKKTSSGTAKTPAKQTVGKKTAAKSGSKTAAKTTRKPAAKTAAKSPAKSTAKTTKAAPRKSAAKSTGGKSTAAKTTGAKTAGSKTRTVKKPATSKASKA